MLLSRICLCAGAIDSPRLGAMLASPYRFHQAVWDLFADAPDRRRDFLYRLGEVKGRPMLWTLSDRPPRPIPELWEPETREFEPVLRPGDRLQFSLRANPVVSREGRRHDVVMEAKHRLRQEGVPKSDWPAEAQLSQKEGTAWLKQRAAAHGFAVEPDQVRVDCYDVHSFHAPQERKIRFATCDFTGLLTVTSVDTFLATLRQGLGPAKGFGCGLFLIRRAR